MKIIINNVEYDAITDINELTVVQFIYIQDIVKKVDSETLSLRLAEILCGVENGFFDDIPMLEISKIDNLINIFNQSDLNRVWRTHKMIGDELYVFKQREDGFTAGEFLSLKHNLQEEDIEKRNLKLLSIMIRPGISEERECKIFYKQEKLDTHPLTIDNRIEIFKKELKYNESIDLLDFFLNTMTQYLENMNSSMVNQTLSKKPIVKKVKNGKATSKKRV